MRYVLVAIQMLLFTLPLAAEDPLSAFVGAADLRTLRAGGTVKASVVPEGTLKLLPAMTGHERMAVNVSRLKPSLGVEMVRLITVSPDPLDSPAGLLKLYNAMHAVSTMQGIPYFSSTRGKAQVLFTQSYAVESAENLLRVPDPVFSEIPTEDVLITFQNDSSFGKNTYQESFTHDGDHLEVKIENLTRISVLFFTFAEPRNMLTQMALIPAGNDLLFYGLACLRTSMPIGDRRTREESLSNRLSAIADWLKTRLAVSPK
jgi:hypothetical protein